MRCVKAILWKQLKDTIKNKTILIQFLMFPMMTIIMENAVKIENMPEHFFAVLFAGMYIGMAPLTAMSAIIAEEKEKNTLRVLLMSNVKPIEYLLGVGIYVWSICLLGSIVIAWAGGYKGIEVVRFVVIMAIGILVSLLMGAAIGVASKNQMTATSVMMPVMMIFSFIPMLSMFNDTIKKVGRLAYTQQINNLLGSVHKLQIQTETVVVIGITILVTTVLFTVVYKKNGIE